MTGTQKVQTYDGGWGVSVTNILSVIRHFRQKRVLSITLMGAMLHATAIPQLQ